jgi:hypothetical protein
MQRGMEAGQNIGEAYRQHAFAAAKQDELTRKMDEIESRTKMNIQDIAAKRERVQSEQVAAFVSAGVELTGSPMSVVSDTLNEAAQAAFIMQREADYDMISAAKEQAQIKEAGSRMNLMLNIAAATVGGYANYKADTYKYNMAQPRSSNRAAGIGEK